MDFRLLDASLLKKNLFFWDNLNSYPLCNNLNIKVAFKFYLHRTDILCTGRSFHRLNLSLKSFVNLFSFNSKMFRFCSPLPKNIPAQMKKPKARSSKTGFLVSTSIFEYNNLSRSYYYFSSLLILSFVDASFALFLRLNRKLKTKRCTTVAFFCRPFEGIYI